MSEKNVALNNHEQREHAILSASSAYRWMHCTRSVALSEEIAKHSLPEPDSKEALEGTLAHEIAESCLQAYLSKKNYPEFDDYDKNVIKNIIISGYVEPVIDLYEQIKALDDNTMLLIEEKIDYGNIATEGFGTSDCIIFGNREIYIIDLKYGKMKVDAEENPQLRLYAIGALNKYLEDDPLFGGYNIDAVCMTIMQPRLEHVSQETMTPEELLDWGYNIVKPLAHDAWNGIGKPTIGDYCKFCPAKCACPAYTDKYTQFMKIWSEHEDIDLIDAKELSELLPILDGAKKWIDNLKEYATQQAILGEKIDGYKIVKGKNKRVWENEQLAVLKMKEVGLSENEMWKLITPAQAEKLVSEDEQQIINEAVTVQQGEPILVDNSDRRTEMTQQELDDLYQLPEEDMEDGNQSLF